MMAMAWSLGIAELLDALGTQINSRELLYNLCLVNRTFHDAFTPHLYKCLRWDKGNIDIFLDSHKHKTILKSGHLIHTRVFVITASAVDSALWAWKHENAAQLEQMRRAYPNDNPWLRWLSLGLEAVWSTLNDTMSAVIQQSPRLQCFACKNVPLTKHCMATLSELTRLTSASISFPPGSDTTMRIHFEGFANMRHPERWLAFSGLRRLSLHNMYGDVRTWRRQVCKTLLRSPQLEHLSLSVDTDATSRLSMLGTNEERDREQMFAWICTEYAALAGRPLGLKSVQLGRSILFPDLPTLDGAFVPDVLESVHFNRDTSDQPIPRALLAGAVTPRLKEISMGEATADEMNELLSNRNAPLQAVRLNDYCHNHTDGCSPSPLERIGGDEALRIPMLMFPVIDWSAKAGGLSPLRHNPWITALAFELRWAALGGVDVFQRYVAPAIETLATMSGLKYLWIVAEHPDMILPAPLVERLARVCPRLLYIRVEKKAWRVRRSEPDARARGFLEPLDEWEDEVEGPRFFHVPDLPRGGVMDHVDWDRGVL